MDGRGKALGAGDGAEPTRTRLRARRARNASPAPSIRIAPLTTREDEIVRRIALGASNRQIAEELRLSERTVEWHVRNVLAKLRLGSRVQIAVWAIERGPAR